MNNFFEIKNIKINANLKNKEEIFESVMEMFLKNHAVKPEYLNSMKARDKESSVALGNYLILPHGKQDSEPMILKNCVVMIHLKKPVKWDDQMGQIVFALALKNSEQMDFIQMAGIAFSDEKEVEKLIKKPDLTEKNLYDFIINNS